MNKESGTRKSEEREREKQDREEKVVGIAGLARLTSSLRAKMRWIQAEQLVQFRQLMSEVVYTK